jgi:quinol monooxygenase YgiN
MITRIVKLTFQPEKVTDFLKVFEATKSKIAAFEGCESLQLMKAEGSDNVFFTVSVWQAASYLEDYRKSAFFTDLWNNTKIHFAAQPEAWSLETVA